METHHNETAVAGTKTVEIKRDFNLPLSTLWKAWTNAETFKQWWGPEGFTCPSCKIDFKVGGQYLASMKSPEGKEFWSTGTFREIVPEKKIVYEDNFSDNQGNPVSPSYYGMSGEWGDVIVTLTFKEVNGKASLTMEQTGIPEEMYDDCITGWQQSFDKIENLA